ncbi:MAG: hypothetical protein R6X20_11130, partial [Phycisphaerae bacterium]
VTSGGGETAGETPEAAPEGPATTEPPKASTEPPAWLKAFREKYPTTRPEVPPEDVAPSDVKFFGVKGEKRPDGSPVQLDPEAPAP